MRNRTVTNEFVSTQSSESDDRVDKRDISSLGQSSSNTYKILLGHAHIEVAIWKNFGKLLKHRITQIATEQEHSLVDFGNFTKRSYKGYSHVPASASSRRALSYSALES